MIVGLIPARGGSKGIVRKNLQTLGGNTLVKIGIDLLLAAGCEKVYVSSEDREIINSAELAGGQVIIRPLEFAGDEASTESVILHAIENLSLSPNDILVIHQITSPLIKIQSVKACIKVLLDDFNFNSAISVYETHPFLWKETDNKNWEPVGHSRLNRVRRQDMGLIGHETGGIYVSRVEAVREQKNRFPGPTKCIPVDYFEALDIDNLDDLNNAKIIFDS
jgi:N-acylneuraminate cytidylyltransferase